MPAYYDMSQFCLNLYLLNTLSYDRYRNKTGAVFYRF